MLKALRKAKLKDKEMRVLMLGLDNAGKTTIVKRIIGEDIWTVSPTLGFQIKTIDHEGYKLHIWDVGGQKTLRTYWRNYFEKTDALIWVLDSIDVSGGRLDDCKRELHALLTEDRLLGASLLVFANKIDIPGALTHDEIVVVLDLKSIKGHNWTVVPCSAVSGEGLKEGMEWVVKDAKQRLFLF